MSEYAEREFKRIADALEEQNRYNLEYIALQKQWRDEAEALTEKRYQERIAFDDMIAERNQEWHDEAERLNELRFQEHREREHALLRAYLESLRQGETKP